MSNDQHPLLSERSEKTSKRKMVWAGLAIFCFIIMIILFITLSGSSKELSKEEIKKIKLFLNQTDNTWTEAIAEVSEVQYQQALDDTNEKAEVRIDVETAALKRIGNTIFEARQHPWQTYPEELRNSFKIITKGGESTAGDETLHQYSTIVSMMGAMYADVSYCDYRNPRKCDLKIDPDILTIFDQSKDLNELQYYWSTVRDTMTPQFRRLYKHYINLLNAIAVANGYSDAEDFWVRDYDVPDFSNLISNLLKKITPFYQQLHAYVRGKLRREYGEKLVSKTGPIPAHILGDLYAQGWSGIFNITAPFPNSQKINIKPALIEQGYTPLKLVKMAHDFFGSLGFEALPKSFWEKSVFAPIPGKRMDCHPTSYEFRPGDVRITACLGLSYTDILKIHHEMGHIMYSHTYRHLPAWFRKSPNDAFHEALGDVMAISVTTPRHLKKIKLLKEAKDDEGSVINYLYQIALEKIAFLPYAYIVDNYRWALFRGAVQERNYNCHWWNLRHEFQGIQPPVQRNESTLDAAAKYHVTADVQYSSYFVSFIMQYQIHQALCEIAGEYKPNDTNSKTIIDCDIFNKVVVGSRLKEMMSQGAQIHWTHALEILTGKKEIDVEPLLNFFKPLIEWLEKTNKKNGEYIGWTDVTVGCDSNGFPPVDTWENMYKKKNKA